MYWGYFKEKFINLIERLVIWLRSDKERIMLVVTAAFMATDGYIKMKAYADELESQGLASAEKYSKLLHYAKDIIESGKIDEFLVQFGANLSAEAFDAFAKYLTNQVVASVKFKEISN